MVLNDILFSDQGLSLEFSSESGSFRMESFRSKLCSSTCTVCAIGSRCLCLVWSKILCLLGLIGILPLPRVLTWCNRFRFIMVLLRRSRWLIIPSTLQNWFIQIVEPYVLKKTITFLIYLWKLGLLLWTGRFCNHISHFYCTLFFMRTILKENRA